MSKSPEPKKSGEILDDETLYFSMSEKKHLKSLSSSSKNPKTLKYIVFYFSFSINKEYPSLKELGFFQDEITKG